MLIDARLLLTLKQFSFNYSLLNDFMLKCSKQNSLQVLPKNTAQLQADPEAHASDLHFLCTVFEGIKKGNILKVRYQQKTKTISTQNSILQRSSICKNIISQSATVCCILKFWFNTVPILKWWLFQHVI